ncbi:MAG: glycosyltransferase [Acidimicrobiales bacterium]
MIGGWLLIAGGLGAATRLLQRVPALRDAAGVDGPLGQAGAVDADGAVDAAGPVADLLVVIPARNEGAVIRALLSDLAAQDVRPSRVVVVADECTDNTEAEVEAFAAGAGPLPVVLERGEPTPPGWNPKSWALHQGVGDAVEARLLFLDADVRLAPGAISTLLRLHHRCGGLLSVAPLHDTGSGAEVLSLPFNLVAIMGAAGPVAPRHAGAGSAHAAFGPCLLIGNEEYRHQGGHRAVAGELLDDVALARHCRDGGVALWLCRGGDLVRYRMYPDGMASLVEGWTKNIALGARCTPPANAVAVALWITALLMPLRAVAGARSAEAVVRALRYWLVVAVHTGWSARRVGRFGRLAAPGAPVWALLFTAVAARSAVLAMLGRPVRWKGRNLRDGHGVTDAPTAADPAARSCAVVPDNAMGIHTERNGMATGGSGDWRGSARVWP